MKNSKIVLLALTLICASCLFAQDLHRGDTIRIKPSDKHYLTSERMSNWVYDTTHVILKVGGTRFNYGVLVEGIYSWVAPEDIQLIAPCNKCREEDGAKAAAKPVTPAKPVVDEATKRAQEQAAIERQKAYEENVAAKRREREEQAIAERRAREELARQQAIEDSIQAEKDRIAREAFLADSLAKAQEAYEAAHRSIDRFTIGVRGGAASMMQNLDGTGKGSIGFDAALDLQYAHYWKTKHEHNVGLIVGASAAFARNQVKGNAMANFRLPTVDGDIDYHINGAVDKLVMNEIQVEVPVMFSLVTKKGFFLNLGPKLMVPVYSFYKQNLTASDITATFVKEGVPVTNEVVTGVFPADQKETKGKWHNAVIHVMLAGELGYEFKLKNNDSFGLGVYGGYSVYNNYKQLDQPQPSYVQITAPTATSCAIVNVKCASDVHTNRLGYWDAGLKLAYHFNWPDRKK